MNILIFGASGKTGQHLVSQALEKGYFVTAFTRHPEKITLRHSNLKIFEGDVASINKITEAIKGTDAILSALGASSPFKYDQVVVDGMVNIIKAMEIQGVKRLIYVSFIGVKESRDGGGFVIKFIAPRLLSTEIKGHEAREKMIIQSNLEWTIVRPATLTNGVRKGTYRSGESISVNGLTATISRADLADFMLRQLNDNSYTQRKPRIFY